MTGAYFTHFPLSVPGNTPAGVPATLSIIALYSTTVSKSWGTPIHSSIILTTTPLALSEYFRMVRPGPALGAPSHQSTVKMAAMHGDFQTGTKSPEANGLESTRMGQQERVYTSGESLAPQQSASM